MRWDLLLNSEPCSFEAIQESGSAHLDLEDTEGRKARITIQLHDDRLLVIAEVTSPPSGTRPSLPEWYNRAHFVVMLDPAHDHFTCRQYAIDESGEVHGSEVLIAPGEMPGDAPAKSLPTPPAARGNFKLQGSGGFNVELDIPAADLWSTPEAPVGLRIKVGFREDIIPHPLIWPVQEEKDMPLTFGDLYVPGGGQTKVDALVISAPAWGVETTLSLGAEVRDADSGMVRVTMLLPEDSEAVSEYRWSASDGRIDLSLPVVFPHRGKWANDIALTASMRIEILSAEQKLLWQGAYPFGFDMGVIVRERYGAREVTPRPVESDPEFVDTFRHYILSRMPDYRQRTTNDGAPSDFYLEDITGNAHLNLSKPGWLKDVAAMITSRFPDWQDALCAASAWVYHPAVTCHSSSWSRLSGQASVETIARVGGCFCGDTTCLLAALSEEIGLLLDVPLIGLSMGMRGHLTTLVSTPRGSIVIDGMIGLWYHTLDNTRLATIEEMRSNREISERMWYCPRAHGHEFFYNYEIQTIAPWRERELTWPAGM